MSELVTWTLRSDVGEAEDCWVGTGRHGGIVGYVQQFKNATACYWHVLNEQAHEARNMQDARESVVCPCSVVYIDEKGTKTPGKDDLSPSSEADRYFRNVVENLRAGKEARFGKVVRVQLLARNGATLDEWTISQST